MVQGEKYQAEEWSGTMEDSVGVRQAGAQNSTQIDIEKLFANLLGNEGANQGAGTPKDNLDVKIEEQNKSYKVELEHVDLGGQSVESNPSTRRTELSLKLKFILGGVLLMLILITVITFKLKGRASVNKESAVTPAEILPEWLVEPPEVSAFEYTVEEVALLRLNGYTGNEIETYEAARVDASELIEEAQVARQIQYEQEIEPYMDSASEEFKELRDSTWLGLDALEVDEDTSKYTRYVEKHNVDYVKVEPRGSQLILKLEMQSGRELFMFVSPEQYVRLRDSGNIVVSIEYIRMGNGEIVVTKIEEILL